MNEEEHKARTAQIERIRREKKSQRETLVGRPEFTIRWARGRIMIEKKTAL